MDTRPRRQAAAPPHMHRIAGGPREWAAQITLVLLASRSAASAVSPLSPKMV